MSEARYYNLKLTPPIFIDNGDRVYDHLRFPQAEKSATLSSGLCAVDCVHLLKKHILVVIIVRKLIERYRI